MPTCELTDRCIFFNDKMSDTPAMSAVYKARYCRHSKFECARWLVFSAFGRDGVPEDLYPNDRLRALQMVRHGHDAERVGNARS